MYWTFELLAYLIDAPWPATKAELKVNARSRSAKLRSFRFRKDA